MRTMPIPPGGYKPPSGRVTVHDEPSPGDRKDPTTGQFRAKGGQHAPSAPSRQSGSASMAGRPSATPRGPVKGPSGGKKK